MVDPVKKAIAVGAVVLVGYLLLRPSKGPDLSGGERIDPEELVEVISEGEAVDIEEYLDDGRYTLVAFSADW